MSKRYEESTYNELQDAIENALDTARIKLRYAKEITENHPTDDNKKYVRNAESNITSLEYIQIEFEGLIDIP